MYYSENQYGFSNGIAGIIVLASLLFYVISIAAFFITPVEERRLELAGETILDSLRTIGLGVKQTATLTNMKLYQNGVFLFGRKRRAVVIPLDKIDSVQLSSGRNYVWLALSIATVASLLYDQGRRDATLVTTMLFLTSFFFVLFWMSGSRRIIVRSAKATIIVDATSVNSAIMGSIVTDERIFGFANRIQSLIVRPRDRELTVGFSNGIGKAPTGGRAPDATESNKCGSCGIALESGSSFCEGCGIPVA